MLCKISKIFVQTSLFKQNDRLKRDFLSFNRTTHEIMLTLFTRIEHPLLYGENIKAIESTEVYKMKLILTIHVISITHETANLRFQCEIQTAHSTLVSSSLSF